MPLKKYGAVLGGGVPREGLYFGPCEEESVEKAVFASVLVCEGVEDAGLDGSGDSD